MSGGRRGSSAGKVLQKGNLFVVALALPAVPGSGRISGVKNALNKRRWGGPGPPRGLLGSPARETSSGLQPILSSALFRTLFFFFFFWWKADCRGGKHPARGGLVLPWLQNWGWREGEVKAETQGRRHQPQPTPAPHHLLLIGTFSSRLAGSPSLGRSYGGQVSEETISTLTE